MTDRTAHDYALEHAEYLAKDVDRLLDAINALAEAEQKREEGIGNEDEVQRAQESLTEAFSSARSGVYEFRKRRDRALSRTGASGDQGVHGWTPQPENPNERATFDDGVKHLYGGDVRLAMATTLSMAARFEDGGSYAAQLRIMANEICKLHLPQPQGDQPRPQTALGEQR